MSAWSDDLPPDESNRAILGGGSSRSSVFLAGGLTGHNVRAAIETVVPFGVDLCSGVRSDGALDPQLIAAFMSEVKDAEPPASVGR